MATDAEDTSGNDEQRRVLLGKPGQEPTTPATLDVADELFHLRPEKWIEEPRQLNLRRSNGQLTFDLGNPRGVVADFEPRPLWGLYDGRPFTVLDARMSVEVGGSILPRQIYEAGCILWDAHIEGPYSPAKAVRIAFLLRRAGWANEDPITSDQGRLSAWSQENRPGLTWEPSGTYTAHDLTQRFPPILTTLLHLWTGEPTSVCAIHLRLEEVGWCTLELLHDPTENSNRSFLDLNKLGLRVVANWLMQAQCLGPLPFLAVGNVGPLQSDAQMLATALEGLHRRLNPTATRFTASVTRKQLNRARHQASGAAVAALDGIVDATVAKKAYDEALSHVNQPSYAERLAKMLPRIEMLAPGLLGPSLTDWIADMKDLRNVQSHGLQNHDDFGEDEISRYYVMASSGRWALKILLLLALTDDDEQMKSALRNSDQFMYTLANIDRETYWKSFSAYQKFLHS